MGKDDENDRVGFVDFVHHDDAKEARNAKGKIQGIRLIGN